MLASFPRSLSTTECFVCSMLAAKGCLQAVGCPCCSRANALAKALQVDAMRFQSRLEPEIKGRIIHHSALVSEDFWIRFRFRTSNMD
jgi:hypothetical protein